ncbi:hypothetical protein [Streptomyces sp. NPDC054784]
MRDLLSSSELPNDFSYPLEFLRVVDLGLTNLEPWWIFDGAQLRTRMSGLKERFPERSLVPFARREDNDDIACWDLVNGGVVVVHDFASPGWELQGRFSDFNTWLRRAVEDLIEHV